MANDPANRGSLFNVRHAVLHSLRHLLFIFSNVLYSRFAIQCSPRRLPFSAPFAIRLVIRRAIRRAVRHSPRRSPFAIRRAVSYSFTPIFAIQTSQFNVRHAVSHSPIAAPFAVAFQCPLIAGRKCLRSMVIGHLVTSFCNFA